MLTDQLTATTARIIYLKAEIIARQGAFIKDVNPLARSYVLWLGHIRTCGEDGINANSIGRLDQILYPYDQADVLAGRLTRQEAVEMMTELAQRESLPQP